jgi:hypothetical protein
MVEPAGMREPGTTKESGFPLGEDQNQETRESQRMARLSILQRARGEESSEREEEEKNEAGIREIEADLFLVSQDPKSRLELARRKKTADKEGGEETSEEGEGEEEKEPNKPLKEKEGPEKEDEEKEKEEGEEGGENKEEGGEEKEVKEEEEEASEEEQEEEDEEEKAKLEEIELDGREKRFALTLLLVTYLGKLLFPGFMEFGVSSLSGAANAEVSTTIPSYSEMKKLVKQAKRQKEVKKDGSVYNKIKWFYYIFWGLVILMISIVTICFVLLWVTLFATMRGLYCYGPARILIWVQSVFTGVDICK